MHVFRILSVIFPLVFQVFAHDEDVYTIKYTVDNFAEEVPKKHHFIMFYAPWCGFCKKLGPTWEQLAEMLNEDDSNIKIAKVDCTTDSSICSDLDVTGYPTLKFFKVGDSEGVRFRGTRDLPTLTNFINEQLRSGDDAEESKTVPITDNGLKELTEENFEKETEKGRTFVKFYAPWCGHCQKLAPVWDELAKSMESNDAVSVGKIDCTQFRTICNNFEVKGYPTLLWLEDGKKIEKYQGDRSLEDLKNYVNKMLGSSNENVIEEAPEADLKAVRDLTGGDFRSGIESGVTFVKFFAPWCGHCKRLAPTWEELGSRFAEKIGVGIAKVDCTLEENKELCNEQEVKGYPTLLWLEDGKKIEKYQGDRSLEDLKNYVNKMLGSSNENVIEEAPEADLKAVRDLTGGDFKSGIESGVTFVKFFAPWCGHCKRLAPTWEELGSRFAEKSGVGIAKVDCTLEENKELCNEQEIEGFPSLFLYKDGKKISEYSGSRSLDDLAEFVNSHIRHDEL